MRRPGVIVALLATVLAAPLALGACAGDPAAPPRAEPTPTASTSRDVGAAYRCLADHSPWTVDLDAVYREWYEAAESAHELRGGTVTGTATVSFTRGEDRRWAFTASGVVFELFYADGAREATTLEHRLTGDYLVAEPGGELQLRSVEVTEARTDVAPTEADGAPADASRVAPPRVPWDAAPGTALGFTCTEHRLLVSTPGEMPASWDLSPG